MHAGPTLILSARFVSAGNSPLKLNFTYHSCFQHKSYSLGFFIFSKLSCEGHGHLWQNHFIEYPATGFPPTPAQGEPGKRGKHSCISAFDGGDAERDPVSESAAFLSHCPPPDELIRLGLTQPGRE